MPGKELTIGEVEAFARTCGPVVQVTLTGGSPELRSDLAAIAHLFLQHCRPMNMTLCSNGNYPAKLESDVRAIYEKAPHCRLTVDISVDALHEDHDRLRNARGLFDRVLESYDRLSRVRERYPRLRLGCGLCVSGLNKTTALATARWAMNNLPLDNFTPILVRGTPQNPEALGTDRDVFLAIASEVEQRLRAGSFRGYAMLPGIVNRKDIIQKRLIAQIHRTGHSPIRCSAARETAVIYPDGTVAGCEIREEMLGDLREHGMDIAKIWRSDAARAFRKTIHKEACTCWHQCFLSPTIIKSPALWLSPEGIE